MAVTKTATLNLRINPAVKEAVKEAAYREHRSVANFIEDILIRQYCETHGITIPEQQTLFEDENYGR